MNMKSSNNKGLQNSSGLVAGAVAVAILAHASLGAALVKAGTKGQRYYAEQAVALQKGYLGTLPAVIVIGHRAPA